jgi:hypothetical protein
VGEGHFPVPRPLARMPLTLDGSPGHPQKGDSDVNAIQGPPTPVSDRRTAGSALPPAPRPSLRRGPPR